VLIYECQTPKGGMGTFTLISKWNSGSMYVIVGLFEANETTHLWIELHGTIYTIVIFTLKFGIDSSCDCIYKILR
jgi:hypothetical protein